MMCLLRILPALAYLSHHFYDLLFEKISAGLDCNDAMATDLMNY